MHPRMHHLSTGNTFIQLGKNKANRKFVHHNPYESFPTTMLVKQSSNSDSNIEEEDFLT